METAQVALHKHCKNKAGLRSAGQTSPSLVCAAFCCLPISRTSGVILAVQLHAGSKAQTRTICSASQTQLAATAEHLAHSCSVARHQLAPEFLTREPPRNTQSLIWTVGRGALVPGRWRAGAAAGEAGGRGCDPKSARPVSLLQHGQRDPEAGLHRFLRAPSRLQVRVVEAQGAAGGAS